MTYKYYKTKGWVGFCDGCNNLFQPMIIDATIFYQDNKSKNHFKMDLIRRNMIGYCKGCCKSEDQNKDDSTEVVINYKIESKELFVRKFKKVMVV